jgi:hypothetical protein
MTAHRHDPRLESQSGCGGIHGNLHIPDEGDQRSGVMSIPFPVRSRSMLGLGRKSDRNLRTGMVQSHGAANHHAIAVTFLRRHFNSSASRSVVAGKSGPVEAHAIRNFFGEHSVPVGSTKSMTGPLLGRAGGLEVGIPVLALRDQILPPTINLENQESKPPRWTLFPMPRAKPVSTMRSPQFVWLRRHHRRADLQALEGVAAPAPMAAKFEVRMVLEFIVKDHCISTA